MPDPRPRRQKNPASAPPLLLPLTQAVHFKEIRREKEPVRRLHCEAGHLPILAPMSVGPAGSMSSEVDNSLPRLARGTPHSHAGDATLTHRDARRKDMGPF